MHTHKNQYKIERETDISRSSEWRIAIAKNDLAAEKSIGLALDKGYCHSLNDAILFSKTVSNKLRINVKNKITLICAKFGANLINIFKVTSRKTVAYWSCFCVTL